MKISALSVVLLLGGAVPLLGQKARGNAENLAAADKAFAQDAIEKGMRTAFLRVLAPESIVFQPGPQNGRTFWQTKTQSPEVLQWEPVLVATDTLGDLGYTTGPWSLKKNRAERKPTSFGEFVSIWRWDKGSWKLIFHIRSSSPPPTGPPPELLLISNHVPNELAADARAVMLAHDRRYAANRAQELPACAVDNIRLYQTGKLPITSRQEAAAALRQDSAPIEFEEGKAEISRGGDLGYVWGEYRRPAANQPGGYYLRIWRKNRAGTWQLALDLLHPR